LSAVRGLRAGRTEARETKPVTPVPDAHIEAIKDHVAPIVWDMVQVQLLTGMRPGEVVLMRPLDIDTTGVVWHYRPLTHKTEHHGKPRVVAIGPKAQRILRPLLTPHLHAFIFAPAPEPLVNGNRSRRGMRVDHASDACDDH
jgi:integrase